MKPNQSSALLCKFCFGSTVRHGSPCKKCGVVHPVESPIIRRKWPSKQRTVIAEEFDTESEDQQEDQEPDYND